MNLLFQNQEWSHTKKHDHIRKENFLTQFMHEFS